MQPSQGHVILVGAGPGDPGLISVKGQNALRMADVVIYDHLISRDLLNHAKKGTEFIYVGKRAGKHIMPQELINQLLVDEAKAGKTVVRLKGGDPFIFGRGGEECLFLQQHNISFEVVPGISATAAVAAYAGIPLTHRQLSTSFLVVTGHEPTIPGRADISWENAAKLEGTIVIFMGIKNLPHITAELLKHGRNPNTPVAVIRWGTVSEQRTITGTLQTIVKQVEEANFAPPGLIVIGEVVGLRDQINWFETKPLFGISAVIPRTHARSSEIGVRIKQAGAGVFEFSCPSVKNDDVTNDDLLSVIETNDWLFFTEAECVPVLFNQLKKQNKDSRALAPVKIAALNDEIASVLNRFGIQADFITNRTCTPPLVKEFASQFDVEQQKFCLVYSEHPPEKLHEYLLKRRGIVNFYSAAESLDRYAHFPNFADRTMNLLIFLSVQAVEDFFVHTDEALLERIKAECTIASVSPLSSQALRERGLNVHIEPERPLTEHLFEAIMKYYG